MNKDLNNAKIGDEELNGVVGGSDYLIFNAKNISGSDKDKPFELLDGTNGNVVSRAPDFDTLEKYVHNMNKSFEYTEDWNSIVDLRNRKH